MQLFIGSRQVFNLEWFTLKRTADHIKINLSSTSHVNKYILHDLATIKLSFFGDCVLCNLKYYCKI